MCGITKITKVADLGNTPAKVNRVTGELFISEKHFSQMDPIHRKFVLFHEQGHCLLKTTSEEAADNYAVDELLKRGYPLSEILKSLTRVLSYNNPEHRGRTLIVFNKLREYDYHVNGNPQVLTKKQQKEMKTPVINVYDEQFNYESQWVGAVLGGAQALKGGIDLYNKYKGMKPSKGNSTPSGGAAKPKGNYSVYNGLLNNFHSAPNPSTWQAVADYANKFPVGDAVFDDYAAKNAQDYYNNYKRNNRGGSSTQLVQGGSSTQPADTFFEKNKKTIIIVVVIVVVVAVSLWLYKRKKKGGK